MQSLMPLLVTAMLLLIPLAPAAILYKLLTPARSRDGKSASHAAGEIGAGNVQIAGMRVRFNVVGSTATYIVLLTIAIVFYLRAVDQEIARNAADLARKSMQDSQTWKIEVPVRLQDSAGHSVAATHGELQLVRVDLEPAITQASAKTVAFRAAPTSDERFPTARFSLPPVGTSSVVLDLNDSTMFLRDDEARRLQGVKPVWITIGDAYGSGPTAPIAGGTGGAP